MHAVRLLLAQRLLVVLVCALALALKMVVPAGYMLAESRGTITVTVCSGTAPRTMTIDIPGLGDDVPGHGQSGGHEKAEMPCAFSGLSAAALGAMDPIQLAALIAFVIGVSLADVTAATPARPQYLRPPLRAPPALI